MRKLLVTVMTTGVLIVPLGAVVAQGDSVPDTPGETERVQERTQQHLREHRDDCDHGADAVRTRQRTRAQDSSGEGERARQQDRVCDHAETDQPDATGQVAPGGPIREHDDERVRDRARDHSRATDGNGAPRSRQGAGDEQAD